MYFLIKIIKTIAFERWLFGFSSHILHKKSTVKQKIHLNRRKYENTTEKSEVIIII